MEPKHAVTEISAKTNRKIRRVERYQEFQIFIRLAEGWFPSIAQADDRHEFLAKTYGFYVSPGGRLGGVDKRVLDVYYGNRPVDYVCELREQSERNEEFSMPVPCKRFLTERGASLRYQRADDGSVVCFLEPARSEGWRRRESGIILAVIREPRVLTGRPILEKHWRTLISYFQCSSLDGRPTILDRLRTWWVLFTRPVLVDGRVASRRVLLVGGEILKWALTIGLSGALLEIVRLSSQAFTGG